MYMRTSCPTYLQLFSVYNYRPPYTIQILHEVHDIKKIGENIAHRYAHTGRAIFSIAIWKYVVVAMGQICALGARLPTL